MRNWIDLFETMNDPTQIVHELRAQWIKETGETPQQINAGQCFDFSDELESINHTLFMSFGIGNFTNHNSDAGEDSSDATGFDIGLLQSHYPTWKPPAGLTWQQFYDLGLADGCHGWAYCLKNHLCYDIEAPDGVANPFDLPWFRRFVQSRISSPLKEGSPVKRRHALYCTVLSRELVIVRMPEHFVRGKDVIRALLQMMKREFGIQGKNVGIEGLVDTRGENADEDAFIDKLEAAFAGSPDYLKKFNLFAWDDATGSFVKAREAVE
jgi:hypothetical protein